MVVEKSAIVIQPAPLLQSVSRKVHCPLAVEQMALRLEGTPPVAGVDALDQAREKKHHPPPLVHDRGPAERARHLAREVVPILPGAGVVPDQVSRAVQESHVRLLENGGPLEGRLVTKVPKSALNPFTQRMGAMPYPMEPLADPAMTVLGCQGTVAAYLIFHTAAVAGSLPFRVEVARLGGRVGWLYCPLVLP